MFSKQRIMMLVLIGCMSFVLTACCCRFPGFLNASSSVVGSWKLKDSATTLSFRRNETFQLDIGGDGFIDIWGTYKLFENRIEFTDSRPEVVTDCFHSGFYHYTRNGKELNFTLFADECVARKNILVQGWESIAMIHKRNTM